MGQESWLPILQQNAANNATAFYSKLEFARNGRRLAAGSDSHIVIYDIDTSDYPIWQQSSLLHLDSDEGTSSFSMSEDGRFLAVKSTPNLIQVWEIIEPSESEKQSHNSQKPAKRVGDDVWAPCPDGISTIRLLQAGENLYLLLACPSYLANRGNVQVLKFSLEVSFGTVATNKAIWQTFLPSLKGRHTGDRFGDAIAVTAAPSSTSKQIFRLAVSSPGFNNRQGLVQIFTAFNDNVGWKQQGDDLSGEIIGERFGASIAISEGEQPYVLIGSPEWKKPESDDEPVLNLPFGRGIVRLYHWRSAQFRAPKQWIELEDASIQGENEDEQFGSAVSITRSGERLAIVGGKIDNSKPANVRIYERNSYSTLKTEDIGMFRKKPNNSYHSPTFAFNDQGSLVAIVSTSGDVQTFVDSSPFCKVPDGKEGETEIWELFLNRDTCRLKETLITDLQMCSKAFVLFGEETTLTCSWESISITDAPSFQPSSHPTAGPTRKPSQIPTQHPSTSPTLQVSAAPSIYPSNYPTHNPSNQPSLVPSYLPSQSPTLFPTLQDPWYPSNVPSARSSSHPSTILHTEVPSGSPSLSPSHISKLPTVVENPSVGPTTVWSSIPTMRHSGSPSMLPMSPVPSPGSSSASPSVLAVPSVVPTILSPSPTANQTPGLTTSLPEGTTPVTSLSEYPSEKRTTDSPSAEPTIREVFTTMPFSGVSPSVTPAPTSGTNGFPGEFPSSTPFLRTPSIQPSQNLETPMQQDQDVRTISSGVVWGLVAFGLAIGAAVLLRRVRMKRRFRDPAADEGM